MKINLSLKEIISGVRRQGISMRRRFALCFIACIISVISILFLLLSILGILNPADNQLEYILTQQLDYSSDQICHDMEKLAAYAVDFSTQLTEQIADLDTSFENLQNNTSSLLTLQQNTYHTVLNNLHLADCSGAFFMLNTTVNNNLEDTYYNGIYLKYANVGSDTMVGNSICMFRGMSQIARQNNINLFSTWECETKKGTFPQMEAVMSQLINNPSKGYLLTCPYKLPEAWEKVRFLCTPIADKSGTIIGVCGFEISDPFFQSVYSASDSSQKLMICGLLNSNGNEYIGQFAPNQSGYMPPIKNELQLNQINPLCLFSDGNMSLSGITKNIYIGASSHVVAVMLPSSQYNSIINSGRLKTILLFLLVAVFAIIASLILSRRYVRPLLKSMEQIKAKQFNDCCVRIPEIDDLFAFLAEQDSINELTITQLKQEKNEVIATITQMQNQYDEANKQIKRLAYSRKEEIDPYDYENFKLGLETLTAKEKEVFNYYIAGKTVKQIMEILQLKESTVRFHNKNIYSKLGIHSLKQLLRYATVMKQENENNNPE